MSSLTLIQHLTRTPYLNEIKTMIQRSILQTANKNANIPSNFSSIEINHPLPDSASILSIKNVEKLQSISLSPKWNPSSRT